MNNNHVAYFPVHLWWHNSLSRWATRCSNSSRASKASFPMDLCSVLPYPPLPISQSPCSHPASWCCLWHEAAELCCWSHGVTSPVTEHLSGEMEQSSAEFGLRPFPGALLQQSFWRAAGGPRGRTGEALSVCTRVSTNAFFPPFFCPLLFWFSWLGSPVWFTASSNAGREGMFSVTLSVSNESACQNVDSVYESTKSQPPVVMKCIIFMVSLPLCQIW